MMILSLVAVLVFFSVNLVASQSTSDCNVDRLDQCSLKVFIYGDPEHKFARNANEARAICRYVCLQSLNLLCSMNIPSLSLSLENQFHSDVLEEAKRMSLVFETTSRSVKRVHLLNSTSR